MASRGIVRCVTLSKNGLLKRFETEADRINSGDQQEVLMRRSVT